LLNLFLGIPFFSDYFKWDCFSQSVPCRYTEKLLIFVYWFCILLNHWKWLWCLWIFWCSLLGVLVRQSYLKIGIIWLIRSLFEFLLFLPLELLFL
jgi:hypothetical protein